MELLLFLAVIVFIGSVMARNAENHNKSQCKSHTWEETPNGLICKICKKGPQIY